MGSRMEMYMKYLANMTPKRNSMAKILKTDPNDKNLSSIPIMRVRYPNTPAVRMERNLQEDTKVHLRFQKWRRNQNLLLEYLESIDHRMALDCSGWMNSGRMQSQDPTAHHHMR